MIAIQGKKKRDIYYYDDINMTITDKEGNCIKLYESIDFENINLILPFIENLFSKLYIEQNELKKLLKDLKR